MYKKRNQRRKRNKALHSSTSNATPYDIFIAHLITAKSLDAAITYSHPTTKQMPRQISTPSQRHKKPTPTPQLISTYDRRSHIHKPRKYSLAPLQLITISMSTLTAETHFNFPTTTKQINKIYILTIDLFHSKLLALHTFLPVIHTLT
jgi:hypothetical protein